MQVNDTEDKLAQQLCDFCELQPATIQCFTCLMSWCSMNCHSLIYDSGKVEGRHTYKTDFAHGPLSVNCVHYGSFGEWCLAKGAKHKTCWMDLDKIKQQAAVILDSVPKFIPELVNIVNEYVGNKVVVDSLLDCLDCDQKWYVGQVVEIRDAVVRIRFDGWSDKWNEWIVFKSTRLAPLHTYTNSYTHIFSQGKKAKLVE